MVLGEGESVPYRGVPYFGEGVWLIEGFHCTYRKIKKRKHTCVATCTYKDPMNMYVNEIQMSNIQMSVCIVSGPPPVISLLLKQPTVLQSPIRLWLSMNNLTVTRCTFLVESCASSVGLMSRGSGRVRRRPSSSNQLWL